MKSLKYNTVKAFIIKVLTGIILILCILPYCYVLMGGFFADGHLSFQAYYDVYLSTPRYLTRFFKSLIMTTGIAMGQVLVAVFAGYAFAKLKFPGKKILYFALLVLMLLPLQVTLVPNYIMLAKLKLLGKTGALIYPGVFLPLGTILITQSFKSVSDDVLDQSRIDGCNSLISIFRIAVPMSKGGIISAGLLSFLDAWNMVEQPIAYLKDFSKYPLSVALAYVSLEQPSHQFACCLLVLLPPLALFSLFSKELSDGIVFGEEK